MHLYLPLLLSGPCGSNDMQMPHSVSENSTVISTNAVKNKPGVHTIAQVSQSDCVANADTAVGGIRGEERERGGGWMAHKMEGKEQKRKGEGGEMGQDPTFQMRTIIKLIA